MTNNDKAKEIANFIANKDETNNEYAYAYTAAMKMAKWKDKQFAKEKKQLIKKVCEWLDKNIPLYEDLNEKEWGDMAREDLLKDLKNEMKTIKRRNRYEKDCN